MKIWLNMSLASSVKEKTKVLQRAADRRMRPLRATAAVVGFFSFGHFREPPVRRPRTSMASLRETMGVLR